MQTILVSGANAIIGYGILRSLRKSGLDLKLVGATIYDDSVAEGFCDIFEKAPLTNDVDYIDWLLKIIKKHRIDLIIPGREDDVYYWNEHISKIKDSGVKVLLNNSNLISLCKDKWLFFKTLKEKGSNYLIETSIDPDFDLLADKFGLPFILKPRNGSASRGIIHVDNAETFLKHKHNIGTILMAQPIVGNDNEEFTTSSFCDGSGGFYAIMTLRRKLSKDGYTEKAEVVSLDKINAAVLKLCSYLDPIGPTNFQFRKHGDDLKLLEINPRISSSTSIRAAFGYNESKMAVEYYLENKKPYQPSIKQGKALRYIEDFIFYEDRSHI